MSNNVLTKIGIIGSGRMGEDIFYLLNNNDYSITWICQLDEFKEKQEKKYNRKMSRLLKTGALTNELYDKKIHETVITTDLNQLSDCHLIIEAVTEDAEIKKNLFTQLDQIVNKGCIFATNTSSIALNKICPDSERKQKFAGLHFFYPVKYNSIVELLGMNETVPETIESLNKFSKEIGKDAIVLPEEGAFILNKLLSPVHFHAFKIYKEKKLNFKEIDSLLKENLFSLGVFDFMDQVGLDVILASWKNYATSEDDEKWVAYVANELQQRVDQGHLGIKTGKGFYTYGNDGEHAELTDSKTFNGKEREVYEKEITDTILCLYVNSVFSVVDKGYCSVPIIEKAMSEYTGIERGPMELGEKFGFKNIYELSEKYSINPSATLKKMAFEQGSV